MYDYYYYYSLTGVMDFGRMDSQTSPARMSVTESARVKMSALDCELFEGEMGGE
jgi:hypothetical protein